MPVVDSSASSSEHLREASSERGQIVLRRRGTDGAQELRVNGVFVMDDRETSTERQLARAALDALDAPVDAALRILVAGLGLGYTLRAVLDDARTHDVLVAEIEPALVEWHRAGTVPGGALDDPRVQLAFGDVRDLVATLSDSSLDLVLLDVDNGPGFLVYDANAAIYQVDFLRGCRRVLAAHGRCAVWSSAPTPDLVATLTDVFETCTTTDIPVLLGSRETTYHLLLAPAGV